MEISEGFTIFFFNFYLFVRDTETQAEGGEAASTQEPDVGLDRELWDHVLSRRQTLNR